MQIKIKGQAFKRGTNQKIGKARWETIDTKDNTLFSGVNSIEEAKRVFENFWNNLNPCSAEIVKCIEIKEQI